MSYITQTSGYIFLAIFGIAMIIITHFFSKINKYKSKEGFLVAGRKVGMFTGATSIAASWIWAPALFISVQMAYQEGLAGIFWFTFPNILALGIFAFLAPKIREQLPQGFTLPEFIRKKLGSDRVHKAYLFPYMFYQLMAVSVQIFAGGSLVTLLTGIPLQIVMPILAFIALAYTLISGLGASVTTDFVQLLLIFAIGAFIIPLTLNTSTGNMITGAVIGVQNSNILGVNSMTDFFRQLLDPKVAFSFGIVTSISLIAGAICDQQYWQRSFAIKKKELRKSFILGAILFGIVPIALSTLGFLARSLNITVPQGIDVSMIGVQTVAQLLPTWAVFLFVVMLLAGLSSTLDSGLAAASSLWVTDIVKVTDNKSAIKESRKAMYGIAIIGLAIAFSVAYIPGLEMKHLWWIFNTTGACVMVPTILALYWNRLSEKGVFYGITSSFVIGIPIFIYSNIINNTMWIVCSSIFIVAISTLFCIAMPKRQAVAETS